MSRPNVLPRTDRGPVWPAGGWLFVPDRRDATGEMRSGYLSRDGERVVLRHTSRLLADFLLRIRQLEEGFAAGLARAGREGRACTSR
ncbi:hypothetical protein ACFYU9_21775 [Streptomyces sp. NPDC004327]|uniref:hypothetical protein n=1 Tax=unclassified Streptomyces TaxID=2593676 RepID=UPI0036B75443